MKHERKAPRRHLIYYLRVYDRASGQQLGHLVDLTTEGVMLVSERKLEKGVHALRMDLPATICGKTVLEFDAECLWSRNDVNPDFYDSGFRLVNPDRETARCIEDLILMYGFRD